MSLKIDADFPHRRELLDSLSRIKLNEQGRVVDLSAGLPIFVSEDVKHNNLLSEEVCVLVLSAKIDKNVLSAIQHDAGGVCFFGTRHLEPGDVALVSSRKIQSFSMLRISREGLDEITDAAMAYVRGWKRFYLIIDMGVSDPAFYKSDGAIPGGLTTRELIYVIQRLRIVTSIFAADIVAKPLDDDGLRLIAHLLAELS